MAMTARADAPAAARRIRRRGRLCLVLVAGAALACESGSGGPAGPVPHPISGPGDFSRTLLSGGIERDYELHVPPGWTAGSSLPLVLAFHGLQSSPANLRAVSGLNDVADQAGVVVAYPAAALGDWNTECLQCGSDAVVEEIDDLGYVSDLVNQLVADAGIDRRRVYVIGISNGALFVHYLACAAQGIVAGMRVHDETVGCAGDKSYRERAIAGLMSRTGCEYLAPAHLAAEGSRHLSEAGNGGTLVQSAAIGRAGLREVKGVGHGRVTSPSATGRPRRPRCP